MAESDANLNDIAYSYIKRDEYTSELYKIEIRNIPKFLSHSELKKLFTNKFKLIPKKVKIIKNDLTKKSKYAFATFSNEEEREKAIAQVNDYVYKNCKLRVFKANPMKDPAVKNQTTDDLAESNKINYDELSEDALQNLLLNQVCPLWIKSYECQLQEKQNLHKKLLEDLLIEIKRLHIKKNNNSDYLKLQNSIDSIFEDIKSIENPNNYRNKCEFSIGKDFTVGFRLGAYKENNIKIVKPNLNCPILNETMIILVNTFENFLKTNNSNIFDIFTHEGNYKQITVRTSKDGCMLIVQLNKDNLSDEELNSEINKLKNLIQNEAEYVSSCYVHIIEKQSNELKKNNLLKHVCGDLHLIEKMKNDDLQFRISPFVFFQVNTKAAELLYETIANLANLNKKTILLDICCGVGTIGIYLSNNVKHVIGIEILADAVNDANYNANINNIKNIEFVSGKAEDNISKIIRKAKEIDSACEIVAILDPPRAGLKNNIIKLIRNCDDITKLIYVSCEPKFAKQNLIELSRPESKAYQGIPFNLNKAISVDMFPHNHQCELVMLFTRILNKESN